MTHAEIRQLAKEALNLGAPVSFTIGEVQSAVAKAAGQQIGRTAVENALKSLVAAGEALVEHKPVMRNGYEVPNARHFYAPRPKLTAADCDPFADVTEDDLVKDSFREAYEKMGGR